MTGIERHRKEQELEELREHKRRISKSAYPGIGRHLARIYQRIITLKMELES